MLQFETKLVKTTKLLLETTKYFKDIQVKPNKISGSEAETVKQKIPFMF
jgi:outer membrane protein assembly factor BamA